MSNERTVLRIIPSRPTIEGAGVRLHRAFAENTLFDPFLLLDDFHSDNPNDYIAGFPDHPHRGIETVTYMIHGKVEHRDSIGNAGVINPGDIQWMTAGSGIIHSEMPAQKDGLLHGFQLWSNLPASHKMMPPRYQEFTADKIPEVILNNGIRVKVISGKVNGTIGPVLDIVSDPEYLDVTIPENTTFIHNVNQRYTVFAYVFDGRGYFDSSKKQIAQTKHLVMFRDGDHLSISTEGNSSVRFLLVSGKPFNEPVAWMGPIVMNTQEELQLAFQEYRNGTFIK